MTDETICGTDCGICSLKQNCGGCAATGGRPFGGECILATCCKNKGYERCNACLGNFCGLKKQLIDEFNALGIADMKKVTDLYPLKGSFVNLEYTLENGRKIKFWDDNKICLGNQIGKENGNRCYGLTADENYLLVCEYGENCADPEIIVYKKRKK
ncbi:MAG: hypothetical protein SPH68_07345 [Candidatus Borkfalkiaceae bacterium]|nr:DUF3795 domain-containing protein [Clostridia bacterium]MDY6223954.1 hypothetical protein [Christensenellaceae bacterium]